MIPSAVKSSVEGAADVAVSGVFAAEAPTE